MSLPEHVGDHLDHMRQRGLSPVTIYGRRLALQKLDRELPVPLLAAGPRELADWRAGLGVGDGAVCVYVSGARQFYAWAIGKGMLTANPAADLPVPRRARRLPRPIAEDDLFMALACADARIRPWLALAGWAGLRACEIAYLRRKNVLETARPPLLLIAADATKGRTERMVPMSSFVVGELRRAGLPPTGWMFGRRDGQPGPNRPHAVSHLANTHLHNCGLAATLHQLRHRFGTETYRYKRDLRMVQELLGHADPSTTAGYAAYVQADAADAVEQLPAPGHLRAVGG